MGIDNDTAMISSVEPSAANVHGLNPVADPLHAEGTLVYADPGYQRIWLHLQMEDKTMGIWLCLEPADYVCRSRLIRVEPNCSMSL